MKQTLSLEKRTVKMSDNEVSRLDYEEGMVLGSWDGDLEENGRFLRRTRDYGSKLVE